MNDKKIIIRNTLIYILGIFTTVYNYSIRDLNINDERNLTDIIILYTILLSALLDFYELLRNGSELLSQKTEYLRLLLAFLFIVVFTYNLIFV